MKTGSKVLALLKQRVVFLCGLFGGHDLGFNASASEFTAQGLFRLHHTGAAGSDDKNIRGGGNDFLNVGQGKGVSGFTPPRMQDCTVWKKDQVFEVRLAVDFHAAEGVGSNHCAKTVSIIFLFSEVCKRNIFSQRA
ncbi:hypothetical protein KKHLCK_10230 [Candidatus Electrothrix laxa]